MPVAFAMLVPGLIGVWVLAGTKGVLGLGAIYPWQHIAVYTFSVVPMFILMGNFIFHAGFGDDVFAAASAWFGHVKGGLAIGTVGACAVFGAACGSSIATSITIGRVAIPQMQRYGYEQSLALASVASAGPLAAMIPPSILMVYYGMVTDTSIGKLLIAGYFPGILIAIIFIVMIYVRVLIRPALAPAARVASWSERFSTLRLVLPVVLVGLVVMGGIYTGFFVPTEAGALGAVGALIIGLAYRRLRFSEFRRATLESMQAVGMVIAIIIGAFIFNAALALSGLSTALASSLTNQGLSPIAVVVGIMIVFIILGTFMDTAAMVFLVIPSVLPLLKSSNIDLVWFGILVVAVCELGMITPPFGLTLFATKAAVPGTKTTDVIRGVTPFIICYIIALVILIAFPQIALFLPQAMK